MAFITLLVVIITLCVNAFICSGECPSLPVLENGKYEVLSPLKVKVICDDSYRYVHPLYATRDVQIITCRRNKWNDLLPKCHLIPGHCLPPKSIENGRIVGSPPYEAGSMIDYYCNSGYYLKGPQQLTCTYRDNEWSDFPPVCAEYDPTSITNIAHHLNEQFVNKMEIYADPGRYIEHDVENEGLDLFLVFDKSNSILPAQFEEGIKFAKFFISRFNVSNGDKNKIGGTRLAVYTFGDESKEEISLEDKTVDSTETALNKLNLIKCTQKCDGGTNMASAFKKIEFIVGRKTRDKAKKALFLTSDGVPTYDPNVPQRPVEDYAEKLRDKEVEIYTVGIGQDIDERLLQTLASSPPEEHVFLLSDFSDFGDVITIIREAPTVPPPPQADKCGYISEEHKKKNPMLNGVAKLGYWPWLAAVIIKDPVTMMSRFRCNAVLICSRWILTSAQCLVNETGSPLDPNNVFVVLGDDNLVTSVVHEQQFYATQIIVYEQFYSTKSMLKHDVALVELNEPVNFNDFVRPVCIQDDVSDATHIPDKIGVMIGWLVPKLEKARISDEPATVFEPSQTNMSITAIDYCNVNSPRNYDCDSREVFLAKAKKPSSKECRKIDLGSPLLMNNKDRYYVAGIASYVEGCTLDSKSAMFFRTSMYREWINTETDFCLDSHL